MRVGPNSSENDATLTLDLPVPWGEVPPEAELQLGLWLQPLSNAAVDTDPLAVGGVVFGTPLGTCPPGGCVEGVWWVRGREGRVSSTAGSRKSRCMHSVCRACSMPQHGLHVP
jgi:hypothetical protein